MKELEDTHTAKQAEALQGERASSAQAIATALEEERQNSANLIEELKVVM